MDKTTKQTCYAFECGEVKRVGDTYTDGKRLYLFDNIIAEHREDGLYVSNAGWFSKTTKERLNGLTGVRIYQSKKKWYLNGNEWDGEWTKVNDSPPPAVDEKAYGEAWNYTKYWKSTDGWRGYFEPEYAVCGANDTGMWDDSPCRSDVAEDELTAAKKLLIKSGIQTKLITCESSNVFCVHHYMIVRPKDKQKAEEIINKHLQETHTALLYNCKKINIW
jgi:hypothetical protein